MALDDEMVPDQAVMPHTDVATLGLRMFLRLPALQRCALVLKDVMGHSIEEIATIADSSPMAVKSALQRGRQKVRHQARTSRQDAPLAIMADDDRRRLMYFVDAFREGEFDIIRQMLSDDVRVDLVNRLRLAGRDQAGHYFTRYGEAKQWRYAPGTIDGLPAMLVYDNDTPSDKPAHVVIIEWQEERIVGIPDFLFATNAMEEAHCVGLG